MLKPSTQSTKKGPKMLWLVFALMTVVTWGLYGAFLAKGAAGFEHDRMKAFVCVGVAYVFIAILAPLIVLLVSEKSLNFFDFPEGIKLSFFAGVLGAIGAFTALMAITYNPLSGPLAASQVMSVIFAGAPIVAAAYAITHSKDGFSGLDWRFVVGLLMAAAGGALVTIFKPN
jgi:hypothetical protein